MARSGHGADESPAAITAQGRSGSARPGAAGRGNRLTLALVGLGLVGHMMRSRRFYQRVTVAVIAVGALRGIGQDNRASAMARLSAWNKREMQRLERKAEHQTAAITGARRMARSGRPRGLAAASDAKADGGRTA
jgi:hypothetical protein